MDGINILKKTSLGFWQIHVWLLILTIKLIQSYLVFYLTVIPIKSGYFNVIDGCHVFFAENEVLLVYIKSKGRILISAQKLLLIINHISNWTHNWKVLNQAYWIEFRTLIATRERWGHYDGANHKAMMVQDVSNFDLGSGIFELPVERAHLLYPVRLQECQSIGGQLRAEHVVRYHIDLLELLVGRTLQIGDLLWIFSTREVTVLH